MIELLGILSRLSTAIISGVGILHLLLFMFLWLWYRSKLRGLASLLDDFTRGLRHRSILDRGSALPDQIDAFIADIKDVLESPGRQAEQQQLRERLSVLDEKRRYLHSMWFETTYNVSRNMIEAYPLGGVLGTILAIGLTLQAGENVTVGVIVARFGETIWCTCAGLIAAVTLMFINSCLEPAFLRLTDARSNVAETVARAKRLLLMTES